MRTERTERSLQASESYDSRLQGSKSGRLTASTKKRRENSSRSHDHSFVCICGLASASDQESRREEKGKEGSGQ